MKELELLKKLYQSYKELNLKTYRLVIAFILMLFSAILEMTGLSLLYPLILYMEKENSNFGFLSTLLSGFAIENQPYLAIYLLFAAFTGLFILKNVVLYFTYGYNINFATYYHKNFVKGLYTVYLNRPILSVHTEGTGYLSNMICTETHKLIHCIIRPLLLLCTELMILAGLICFVFVMNPLLLLTICVGCIVTIALYYLTARRKALEWGKKETEANTIFQQVVHNTASGISEIRVFGQSKVLIKKIEEIMKRKIQMFYNLEMYQQIPRYIIETTFVAMIMLYFSLSIFFQKELTVLLAQVSIIAAAAFRILPSINRVFVSYSTFSFNLCPAITLMDTVSEIKEIQLEEEKSLSSVSMNSKDVMFDFKKIEFINVGFQYPQSTKNTINNISFQINKQKRIGIVGSSGSGKSTLIKVLAGLYPQSSGQILCNGLSIHSNLALWQSQIAYVPQSAFLMPGTLRENIVFGNPIDSEERIWSVLEYVKCSNFVRSLPNGLDTMIGVQGIDFSGGQRQLICLSRALYRQPKLLLLDEPTASLDANNERIVLDVINNLPSDVIIVMISHKMSNFENFQEMYLCEDGKLNNISLNLKRELSTEMLN